ncbi:MAG: GAF domain-containing protein [Fulvivirga sp.]|nr:GAF domain-containing protein [Fulvivirga sp.]
MLFEKISKIGTEEEGISNDLQQKVKLSNQIAVIIGLGVALPFTFISLIYFSAITFIPIAGLFICMIVVALNAVRLNTFSRFLIALLPVTLAVIYNAYLLPAEAPLMFEMYCLALSFVIIPFLVFDLQEKRRIIACMAYIIIVLAFLLEPMNDYFEEDLDITVITEGYLGTVNIILSVIFLFASISVLAYQNLNYKKKSESLVEEMDERNAELRKSEQKLKDNIKKIEEQQEEEKRRNWATQGIAQFSNLMRSNKSSEELYQQIVYDLTKYIKANQCWLFLVNTDEDDVKLELKACYAYDRHKYLEKTIEPGQGLVGQAYLEKKHIYLKEVPEEYVNITSGLGKAPPRSILIMPLIVNEEVQGIFEIASFNHFDEHEVEFVQELGETIASFISVNRINEKTKILLEETQQQAEEMRSQEEEMRQNMEELAATQEEMQRKEKEYIARIDELEAKVGQNDSVKS